MIHLKRFVNRHVKNGCTVAIAETLDLTDYCMGLEGPVHYQLQRRGQPRRDARLRTLLRRLQDQDGAMAPTQRRSRLIHHRGPARPTHVLRAVLPPNTKRGRGHHASGRRRGVKNLALAGASFRVKKSAAPVFIRLSHHAQRATVESLRHRRAGACRVWHWPSWVRAWPLCSIKCTIAVSCWPTPRPTRPTPSTRR